MKLSHRHPLLYKMAVFYHRNKRRLKQRVDQEIYVSPTTHKSSPLPHNVKRHSSRLLKKLGETEMWLQHNKVKNLKICVPLLNGLIIRPGESFSFCRIIGKPTRKRGFVEGVELSMGKARPGVGGGICQIANMLHWLVLHSPLTVVERSTHSFDPFPDENRSIPFGTGCAVFYNYVDFCFKNETSYSFHLSLKLDDNNLHGHLTSDQMIEHSYKVFEKDHRFVQRADTVYRENEIWRHVRTRLIGDPVEDQFIKKNCVRVLYHPDPKLIFQDSEQLG